MVNVNGGRVWSAATKVCPDFLGSLTQVKYFSTNLITVRAHRGHTLNPSRQQKYRQPPARYLHAVHQLPELDAPRRHDHLDVREQVPEVTRGQRRTRHDHDERFAQLTQAREDSGKLTEWWVGHHAVTDVCLLYTSPSPRDQRGSRMPSSA